MFATIRKHQQWLFVLICGVIIISFVIFFSPDVGFGDGGRKRVTGMIDGQPIPQSEFDMAYEESAIELFLSSDGRYWPWSRDLERLYPDFVENFDRGVLERVVMVRKLDEMKIDVSQEAVVERVRLSWKGATGAYDPAPYKYFITNSLANVQGIDLNEADYFRLIRHQLAQNQLRNVYGVSGQLVTRAAAEAEFRRENERVATEAVFFKVADYLPKVTVETNALRTFFTNRQNQYRIPAQAQISYVQFAATNFMAEAETRLTKTVTNLAAEIERVYLARGTNTFTDDDGKVLSAEKAHEQIRDEQLKPMALLQARSAANEFAHALHAEAQRKGSLKKGDFLVESNFIQVAEAVKLKVQTTEPFSRVEGPADLDARSTLATAAFELGGTNLVRIEPIIGQESVFLIARNKLIPSKAEKFEDVKEKVTEDYKQQEAQNAMTTTTREFYQKITNSIAGGKEFKLAAEELKLTVVEIDPFSKSESTNFEVAKQGIKFPDYRGVAFQTKVGEVCYPRFPQPNPESGFILHVKKSVAADEAQLEEELDGYVDMFRQGRKSAAYDAWRSREMKIKGVTALPSN